MYRVIVSFAAVILTATVVVAQEVIWQQEYQANLDGEMTCAYSGGFMYAKPALVDIDDDGDLDLFVGERYTGVDFIRNDGDRTRPQWTFVEKSFVELFGNYFAPAFCDIDGDGDEDAFIGESDGQIDFLRNDGNSTSPPWTLETEAFDSISMEYHATPAFCDIDADTDFDLFVGDNKGNVFFYRNEGTPEAHAFVFVDSFFVIAQHNVYSPPTFADIDNDQDFDLFVGAQSGIYFYRNDGDAGNAVMTQETTRYADIRTMHNCAVDFEDIDNDGDLDLFVGDAFKGITYYRNIGDANSASWELVTDFYATIDVTYPGFPAFADIDGDGDLDLFMGRYYEGIYMFENAGTRSQEAWVSPVDTMIGKGSFPAFCDIDGDEDFDLFCGKIMGNLVFYENTGSPEAAVWSNVNENYNTIQFDGYCSPAFCDIDDDGDYDLFTGKDDGTLSFYENVGDRMSPQWAVPDSFFLEVDLGIRSMPAFCDIDQDEDFDLFIGARGGVISFYRNEGNRISPSFVLETDQYASIVLRNQTAPVFADIDGDGDPDLFVGDDDGGLNFWRNMGVTTGVIDGEMDARVPGDFVLYQNYPNPFNPTTDIRYEIGDYRYPIHVTLNICNVLGQEVSILVDEVQEPGQYTVQWDAQDVTSGIYFYRLVVGEFTSTKRMVLIK